MGKKQWVSIQGKGRVWQGDRGLRIRGREQQGKREFQERGVGGRVIQSFKQGKDGRVRERLRL